MTIRQAVLNVCSRLRVGDKLKIYQIYDRVMLELKNSDSILHSMIAYDKIINHRGHYGKPRGT